MCHSVYFYIYSSQTSGTENVALNKSTSQSNTRLSSDYAVDGEYRTCAGDHLRIQNSVTDSLVFYKYENILASQRNQSYSKRLHNIDFLLTFYCPHAKVWVKVMLSVCLSVHKGRGGAVPQLTSPWSLVPSTFLGEGVRGSRSFWEGGYPSQVLRQV